jgi:DNA polymerase-1
VYRTSLALSEATAFRDAFLEHYQGVRDWHDVTKRSRPPVVRTASGRMRYVGDDPNAFCARLNTPVQGTAADGLKRAMVLLAPRLEPFGAGMVLSIHDELLVDTPTACAQEVRKVTIEAMREGMQEFVQTVPIVVKSEVRDSWGKGES